ncbi:MAG: thioredoxin family protein [Deltaproteobacteria bacterium]|nr:thioredoxin family protein [Deltaproteobacteria bacterium]
MPRLSVLVGLVLLAVMAWALAPAKAAAGGIHWLNYQAAVAAQKNQGKPMLVYFHLPYCYRCKEMKWKVYSQAAVISELNRDFIAAKVNADKDKATVKLYDAEYTPTYVFLNKDGKQVFRTKGVMSVERFLGVLDYVKTRAYTNRSLEQFMEGR